MSSPVAPICHAVTLLGCPITPRIYEAHVTRAPFKRPLEDMSITELLAWVAWCCTTTTGSCIASAYAPS